MFCLLYYYHYHYQYYYYRYYYIIIIIIIIIIISIMLLHYYLRAGILVKDTAILDMNWCMLQYTFIGKLILRSILRVLY